MNVLVPGLEAATRVLVAVCYATSHNGVFQMRPALHSCSGY